MICTLWGGMEGGRVGGREGGIEGGREGGREGEREGEKEGGKEGGKVKHTQQKRHKICGREKQKKPHAPPPSDHTAPSYPPTMLALLFKAFESFLRSGSNSSKHELRQDHVYTKGIKTHRTVRLQAKQLSSRLAVEQKQPARGSRSGGRHKRLHKLEHLWNLKQIRI